MRTAVISGSSSGIGKAITELLLDSDFKVYGVSKTSPEINNSNFFWVKADLTEPNTFKHIADSISEDSLDVLINNAGVAFEKNALDFSEEDFKKTFGINFRAPILLTEALRGKLQKGLVINISSVSDRLVGEGYALYCSSKAALNIYFDVVALEEKNVNFISILPSYVDTPLLRRLQENNKDFDWDATIKPSEIAQLIGQIIGSQRELPNGAHVIVVSDALKEDLEYSENLWGYNVTTKTLARLKRS